MRAIPLDSTQSTGMCKSANWIVESVQARDWKEWLASSQPVSLLGAPKVPLHPQTCMVIRTQQGLWGCKLQKSMSHGLSIPVPSATEAMSGYQSIFYKWKREMGRQKGRERRTQRHGFHRFGEDSIKGKNSSMDRDYIQKERKLEDDGMQVYINMSKLNWI